MFDSMTGVEKCRVNNSLDDSLTCATWHHSSKKFYVGGLRGQFYECVSISLYIHILYCTCTGICALVHLLM